MGQKPDDIAREIDALRRETDIIVDELIRRVVPSRLARGVTSEVGSTISHGAKSVAGRAGGVAQQAEEVAKDAYYSLPRPVRNYPYLVGGAVLGALAGVGAYAFNAATQRPEPSTQEMILQRLQGSLGQAGGAVQDVVQQAQRDRHVWVDIDKGETGMVKRLLWVAMVSVMAAFGSMLFKRLSVNLWRGAMHEEPPR